MRLRPDAFRSPQFKPHAQRARRRPQSRQGAIEKTAAIAQTITRRVKRVQRNDKDIGLHGFSSQGRGNAKGIVGQWRLWRPDAEKQWCLRRDGHGQGGGCARLAPDFDGGAYIGFVVYWPAKGDAVAGRLREGLQQMRDDLP
jgi:hypothetical protein